LAYADEAGAYVKEIETAKTEALRALQDWLVTGVAWFPDSSKLLVSGRDPHAENEPQIRAVSISGALLWSVPHDAGDVATVLEGSHIAFISGNGREVWLMKPREEPRLVYAGEEGDRLANLSGLSAEQLLFSRLRIGEY